jgi:hypothetical protein
MTSLEVAMTSLEVTAVIVNVWAEDPSSPRRSPPRDTGSLAGVPVVLDVIRKKSCASDHGLRPLSSGPLSTVVDCPSLQ